MNRLAVAVLFVAFVLSQPSARGVVREIRSAAGQVAGVVVEVAPTVLEGLNP